MFSFVIRHSSFVIPFYLFSIASWLQTVMHFAHLTHFEISILWGDFFSPDIAPAAQAGQAEPAPAAQPGIDGKLDQRQACLAGHFCP